MNRIIYVWVLLASFSMIGKAQSIEELIDMATAYNPGLKSLRMDYEASLLKADQVNDWPDPKVNLAVGVFQ